MNELYVVGSINIDESIFLDTLPIAGETKYGQQFSKSIGGKGANQALAAATLGVPTHFIGKMGNDGEAQRVLDIMKEKHIETSGITIDDQVATGKAYILCENSENRIILNPGANGALTTQEVLPYLTGKPDDILLVQFELPMEVTKEAIRLAKQNQMRVVLNPAPADRVALELLNDVDYLVINQSEAELLTGEYPNTLEEGKRVYERLREYGLQKCILTLGANGSLYFDATTAHEAPPLFVEAVDSTGAGDAFIGAFIYGLLQNESVADTLYRANVTGALACLTIGAENATPTLSVIKQQLKGENTGDNTNTTH
ncbi:MAG: ribokinase [Aerococcaceae bacterium]|nr:ribokinase [Aerococcaceae bacterium]